MTDNQPKYNTQDSNIIMAQMYVAKHLNKEPLKAIKFLLDNKSYFPNVDYRMIEQIKIERNITNKMIEDCPEIKLSEIK